MNQHYSGPLQDLVEVARPHLDNDALRKYDQRFGCALDMLGDVPHVLGELAALIYHDATREGRKPSGYLQNGESVAGLLWAVGTLVDMAHGFIVVGGDAGSELRRREAEGGAA